MDLGINITDSPEVAGSETVENLYTQTHTHTHILRPHLTPMLRLVTVSSKELNTCEKN